MNYFYLSFNEAELIQILFLDTEKKKQKSDSGNIPLLFNVLLFSLFF